MKRVDLENWDILSDEWEVTSDKNWAKSDIWLFLKNQTAPISPKYVDWIEQP